MSAEPRITVHHAGQHFGPYTLDQVNAMLTSGRLADHDLAWVEGTPDWLPLHSIPGVLRMPALPSRRPLAPDESERLILPAFLLAFFLGVFGVHRFYAGKIGSGVAMIILTVTVIGAIASTIWAIVDWVLILSGSFTDAEGKRLTRWT